MSTEFRGVRRATLLQVWWAARDYCTLHQSCLKPCHCWTVTACNLHKPSTALHVTRRLQPPCH